MPIFVQIRRFFMATYKKLLVASAKGGVGKSTTSLGLAVSLAKMGKKTLLVDLDNVSRSLDLLSGASDMSTFDIGDVIEGGEISSVTPFSDNPNLSLIPACSQAFAERVASERGVPFASLVREAIARIASEAEYDVLVCDTGAGIEMAKAVCGEFDMILIVSEQGKTSVRAADYAASELISAGASCMRLVICSFDVDSVKRENRAGVIEIIDASELRCIGVVPYDASLQRAQDAGRLPSERSLSSVAYTNIAKRIVGVDTPLFFGMKRYRRKLERAL